MEPENTPLEKEKHLYKSQTFGVQNVSFRGCSRGFPIHPNIQELKGLKIKFLEW